MSRTLRVVIDGEELAPEEARAFWARFSEYMEANKGDLSGFAKAEGFTSVHPQMGAEGAVLAVSRTELQKAYSNVSKGGSKDGSSAPQPRSAVSGQPKKKQQKT